MLDNNKNFWTFLLFNFLTCGIYGIIYLISFFNDINTLTYDDGEPLPNYLVVFLLGLVTCGIYTYWIYYKMGDKLYNCGQRRGVMVTETAQTILIWCLVGLVTGGLGVWVAMFFCFENYNKLATHYNQMVSSGQPMGNGGYAQPNQNAWGTPNVPNQAPTNDYWNNNQGNSGNNPTDFSK